MADKPFRIEIAPHDLEWFKEAMKLEGERDLRRWIVNAALRRAHLVVAGRPSAR